MRITWNELTISFDGLDLDQLLVDWRWLVPESMTVVLISALGDLFLCDEEGVVHWLDAGAGQLSKVADSPAHFKELMVQPENANQWFVPQLIGDLMQAGHLLGPGQCYSCEVPPGLGGEYALANIQPTDIQVHFSVLGQIFQQTQDLPDGAQVSDIRLEDD